MTKKITKRNVEKKAKFKTNPEKIELIIKLKKQKEKFWLNVANKLANQKTKQIVVNLEKIEKLSKDNEIILIPGKVLGNGKLTKKITLAAFSITQPAKEKLKNIKIITIEELLKEKTSNIKLII